MIFFFGFSFILLTISNDINTFCNVTSFTLLEQCDSILKELFLCFRRKHFLQGITFPTKMTRDSFRNVIYVLLLKLERAFDSLVMFLNYYDEMANSVDPDQNASLGAF